MPGLDACYEDLAEWGNKEFEYYYADLRLIIWYMAGSFYLQCEPLADYKRLKATNIEAAKIESLHKLKELLTVMEIKFNILLRCLSP